MKSTSKPHKKVSDLTYNSARILYMIECFTIKKAAVFFNNSRHIAFLRWCCYHVSLFLCIISMLILSGCGCNKKKKNSDIEREAPVSRLDDKEYVEELNAHREDQKVVARERNQLADEMKKVGERVKGSLKPDAGEEEFKAALAKNEEWQELLKKQARLDQDVKNVLQEARETVRNRLLREQTESNATEK